MDELTALRRLDAETPAPTEQAMTRARSALDERMHAERRRPDMRPVARLTSRRGLVLTGLGVAAAACVAVTSVSLAPAPRASAVAMTLRTAATNVAASGVASTGTRVHYTRLVTSGGRIVNGKPLPESGVLLDGTMTLEPVRGTDAWTRNESPLRPIAAWGPDGARVRQQAQHEYEAADGRWTVTRSTDSGYFWDISPKQVAALPRDPEALARRLQGITDPDSAYVPNTERAIDQASAILQSGLADAGLQAAVYRALEHLPGLLLTERARDLDGRPGVGIGTVVSRGQQRIDIVIDPASGRFLGRAEIDLVAINGAPAGTAIESTAVYPG